MRELSLHILDIIQNSVEAGASFIELLVEEDLNSNILIIKITDNGMGMKEDLKKKIQDPFFTTRNTRKVGLGIPFLKAAAERCEGKIIINSSIQIVTIIKSWLN